MNPFSFVYTEILFRPLLNLLVGITNVLPAHNIGIAIILVTLIVRLVLLPSSLKQARSMQHNQNKMKKIQGDVDKIKEKHKDDKQKQAEETMKLYKEQGINPASGCLPLLIQLPILIALYRVFLTGLSPDTFDMLYSFVSRPEALTSVFLGIDLREPSLQFGILAGIFQFIQMKWLSPSPQQAAAPGGNDDTAAMMQSMQKNMIYIFPAMTIFISLQLPGALALYLATTTLFGIIQQYIVKRTMHISGNVPMA